MARPDTRATRTAPKARMENFMLKSDLVECKDSENVDYMKGSDCVKKLDIGQEET
jgi:hypothetical protein